MARRVAQPVVDRVLAAVRVDESSGCWLWTKCISGTGYGLIKAHKPWPRMLAVHRVLYEEFVGPIPSDLEIDHLCRVRACCNPEHLEAVTHADNMRRSPNLRGRLVTHCPSGHEYTEANTYRPPGNPNKRYCRECRRK